MRTRRWILALVAGTLVLTAGIATSPGGPPDDAAPSAAQVVVRGKKVFAEALQAAARPAWAEATVRPVLLVFDVTPFVRRGRTAIEEGLAALGREAVGVRSWSVAALGGKSSKPVDSASLLGSAVTKVLAEDTPVVSTLTALAKSIKSWREKDGVVVYVADWHFEDDVDLEGFIESLRKKRRTLSVVGTEAAFRRGWNDGLRDTGERFELDIRGTSMKDYWAGVGRDPFGGRDKQAPWHGGDTAYPYAPYRWCNELWASAFSLSEWDASDMDDELGGLFGGSAERTDIQERLDEIRTEIAGIDEQLARTDLDDAARADLESRREALDREREERMRDLLKTFGGELADEAAREERLEALRKERGEINDRLGELFEQSLDADEAEEARLAAEQQELEARRDALTAEIEKLEAESAPSETPDAGLPPGGGPGAPVPPDGGIPDPEDLKGRLPDGSVPDDADRPEWIDTDDVLRKFPLPSSYGPYGLMRAAGVTGGRYVLFSWNPSGRKTVVYEYSRCNLFPPDLRSRKAILADLRENPWGRSMLAAWWSLANARVEVLEQLPPLRANLRSASRMDRTPDVAWIPESWDTPSEQKLCVRLSAQAAAALDDALRLLDEGLAAGGEPKTDIEQRYHAEALLFRHAARVARFELREKAAVAQDVPRSAFRKKGENPGVTDQAWVRRGRNPKQVRTWQTARPRHLDEGMAIVEERKALLERFRGTPFGEQLAMNTVDTTRPVSWETTDTIPDTGRSPSESTDMPNPTPPPPGGSSGPGGPTTGGD